MCHEGTCACGYVYLSPGLYLQIGDGGRDSMHIIVIVVEEGSVNVAWLGFIMKSSPSIN